MEECLAPQPGVLWKGCAPDNRLSGLASVTEGSWRALHAFGTQITFVCDAEPRFPLYAKTRMSNL